MKDFINEINAYALKNALEFGKADAGKILPKLFQHGLEKEKIKEIMPEISKITKKINSMKNEERERELEKYKKFLIEKKEEEKGLPQIDISGIKKVVTRIAPEPSKYNHIGHALTFLLNYLYAQKYKGKCLLRFEDTNPEKVSKEYVDAMKEDVLDYLGIKVEEIRFVSDDMSLLYKYAEKLVGEGKVYVCFCDREKMQDLRHKGMECECREFDKEIHIARWKEFFKGKHANGDAVLRLKGNMQSLNHVMRDPVLFRYLNAKHYRHGNKYKVCPMYDFYNLIEDSLMGITLILRSNEFDTRVELQDYIKELLGLKKQKIIQYGRFNVIDFTTKGREIREMIESGEFIGWDDPRLVTLRALRRRGITREAIYELANQVGLSKHEVNLSFDMIAAINRKIVDSKADRYFFVQNPREIKIVGAPKIKKIEVKIHPDRDKKKEVKLGSKIFISSNDFENIKGKEVRLLHLYNVLLEEKSKVTSVDNKDIPKIQWVSLGVRTRVMMPDGKYIEGLAERAISKLKKGEIIQFERFGFVRFDSKKKGIYEFWFAHK